MYVIRNWLLGTMLVTALCVAPALCIGAPIPDTITINTLEKLYDKVKFNHAKHIAAIKDCGDCHHHTTGTLMEDPNCARCHKYGNESKTVSCKGCHSVNPFSAETLAEKASNQATYHRDKPGLKGAYHQSCIGCHAKKGGPTGCLDCHGRKKEGDALYNAGEFAPKAGAKKSGH